MFHQLGYSLYDGVIVLGADIYRLSGCQYYLAPISIGRLDVQCKVYGPKK